MDVIKGHFQITGINEVDVDLVCNNWNHLWMLAEWQKDNSWILIKHIRKYSGIVALKITISWKQANEIVKKLDLRPVNSGLTSGYTWRTIKDFMYLDEYRRNKLKLKQWI